MGKVQGIIELVSPPQHPGLDDYGRILPKPNG
jgi:hypothetical protein